MLMTIQLPRMKPRFFNLIGCLMACTLPAACERTDPWKAQGYVEGDFVRIASPSGGRLLSLSVERGVKVAAGDELFRLDDTKELAARDEAARRVDQARALLEDSRRGLRPTEIASLEAQFAQAEFVRDHARIELERQSKLKGSGATAKSDFDQAKSNFDQAEQRVGQTAADLATAKLGSREAQIAASESSLKAQEALLASTEWELAQMRQTAQAAGQVTDILYHPGEWVPADSPVVEMLPPANIKVRVFVSQAILGSIQLGDEVDVRIDGIAEPVKGRLAFIAPQAEFTPPVIYSEETREKFVYLLELALPPGTAARLHPGQPVDAHFKASGRTGE